MKGCVNQLSKSVLETMLEELMKQYSPKQILEAAKKMHKEQAEAKSTWLPSVRCTTAFRQTTEQSAAKVDKTITEYIYDAVEDSNKKLAWPDWENDSSAPLYKKEDE